MVLDFDGLPDKEVPVLIIAIIPKKLERKAKKLLVSGFLKWLYT